MGAEWEGDGRVRLPGRRAGIGQFRASKRRSVRATGALYGWADDPEYPAERRAHWDPALTGSEPVELPGRENLPRARDAEDRGTSQSVQRAEREHGNRHRPAIGIAVPAAREHSAAAHCRTERA